MVVHQIDYCRIRKKIVREMKEERKGRYLKELLDLFLPADADAVESGHVLAGVGEDVLDDAE